jgi:hypothetical protein
MRRPNGQSSSRKVMILPEIGPVDGRTRPAIKFRETAAELVSHLGGREMVTAVQMEIVLTCSPESGS